MEGTNDLSRDSAAEVAYRVRQLVWAARDESGVAGVQVMIATLIPRIDKNNEKVPEANQRLLTKVAQKEGIPLADPWQAFQNYGPWQQLYIDHLHPGSKGLEIIANTFYQKMVSVGWLPDDPNPPSAWITSLPAKSDCFVPVEWTGDDGTGSGIASFDVQVQINGGSWTNWLAATPQDFGFYVGKDGQNLGFRVRARDKVGNVGDFSAPDTTQVDCTGPIERAFLPALLWNASQ
jgi:hypothetical protein